jgi:para-aminobenzoate synthetase/4-amino-4-deoxychorismate lyase
MFPHDPAAPFVLLDDMSGTAGATARLYRDPIEIVATADPVAVPSLLDRLRAARAAGRHVAGYLAFEAFDGPAIGADLLWFGLFDRCETIAADALPARLPDPAGAWAGPPVPSIDYDGYAAAIERTLALIAAGDIYQANVTFAATVATAGDPLALYARLRRAAGGPWGGIVHTGSRWLLSFSPELFFQLEGRHITVRPMKGTAARHAGDDDAAVTAALAADPKQRAENLMIVDLMRNDLSRVAAPGSVAVPDLFTVETYPTIHQMTSTVTAELAEGRDAVDILAAAFPCGSVTGAPKVRAMAVIRDVEQAPRGAYTGSIGYIDANGHAAFNVAIRTLTLAHDESLARIGLGSGIVADSAIPQEWDECLAKGAFVTSVMSAFDLFETMRFDSLEGIVELDFHVERLGESAGLFGFPFDRHGIRNELQAATFKLREDRAIRLMVSAGGGIAIETRPVPEATTQPVAVALAPLPVAPADFRLRHKTSDRGFYRDALAAAPAGSFEVVFVDPAGFLTEGSFTTVFVARDDGILVTPPLSRGLLPGVLRRRLLADGRAIEGDLTPEDLAGGFLIGNSLRGLIRARLVAGAASAGL